MQLWIRSKHHGNIDKGGELNRPEGGKVDLPEIIERLRAMHKRVEYVNAMSNEERIIQETFHDLEALKKAIEILENMPEGENQ